MVLETKGLKGEVLKKDERLCEINQGKANTDLEKRRLVEENDTLKSEVARMRKELEVRSIGDSIDRLAQLQEQNRRMVNENSRLREEINIRDIELAKYGASGPSKAYFVERKDKSPEEKLTLANAENKRLSEEVERLRAALDESHVADTGSRFKDQHVTGKMIEDFKEAKSRNTKWATVRNKNSRKQETGRRTNETDDIKMMKIEEMAL